VIHIKIKDTPPSTQHIYLHKGRITFMTKEGKDYKEFCQWNIKSQYKGKIIKNDISVVIELYFADKRRRDLDNFNKIILDSCTGLLWKDDCQIIELTIRKFIDKKPRVELFIL